MSKDKVQWVPNPHSPQCIPRLQWKQQSRNSCKNLEKKNIYIYPFIWKVSSPTVVAIVELQSWYTYIYIIDRFKINDRKISSSNSSENDSMLCAWHMKTSWDINLYENLPCINRAAHSSVNFRPIIWCEGVSRLLPFMRMRNAYTNTHTRNVWIVLEWV